MTDAFNRPLDDPALLACPECDLVQRLPVLAPGATASCPRCACVLGRGHADPLDRPLALALAAAVLYAIANLMPMLGLTAVGHAAQTTVAGGAVQLWHDGRQLVALLVAGTAVVAPGLQIGAMLGICLAARRRRPPRWIGVLLRHHPTTRLWSMIEVMLLGVLVALIKIADYATVIPGAALYALGGLMFVLAGMQASFDPRAVWARLPWAAEPHAAEPAAAS